MKLILKLKTIPMKYKLIRWIYILVFLGLSVAIPYTIQFKLNFLGATMITMGDIVELWVGPFLINFLIMIVPFINNESKIGRKKFQSPGSVVCDAKSS